MILAMHSSLATMACQGRLAVSARWQFDGYTDILDGSHFNPGSANSPNAPNFSRTSSKPTELAGIVALTPEPQPQRLAHLLHGPVINAKASRCTRPNRKNLT